MARKRKPKIIHVEAPDESAPDPNAEPQFKNKPKVRRKTGSGTSRRPARKVIQLSEDGKVIPRQGPAEKTAPESESPAEEIAAEASAVPVELASETSEARETPEMPKKPEVPALPPVPELGESPAEVSSEPPPEKPASRPPAWTIPDPRIERPPIIPKPRTATPPISSPQAVSAAAPAAPPPASPPGMRPPRRPSRVASLLFGGIFLAVLAAFIFIPLDKNGAAPADQPANCLGIYPNLDWGYALHELNCRGGITAEGENLSDILLNKRVSYKSVIRLMDGIDKQSLPGLQPGNRYTVLYHEADPLKPYLLAYAPDPTSYVLLNLNGEPQVEYYKLAVEEKVTQQMEVAVITNLAEAMFNREFGLDLARKMEGVLKWKLDLFHLAPGDRFSLLYDEVTYEGGARDIGRLTAVRYRYQGEEGYAIYYQDAYVNGFFDLEGRPLRSGFLKAPLEYGRISSAYNLRRRDPLSKTGEIRAHLGTDYAAPLGTPILAVANGIVLKAERKGGNGNYVKLFHSPEIQTQYLHMRNFAEGIEPGVEVRQGQVIGYVGQTGRATGPHVCFRYWKDGVQVDHRKEKFLGPAPPLREGSREQFQQHRDSVLRFFEPA